MFDTLIQSAAQRYDVPVPWIQAVIARESNWDPKARNMSDPGGGAWGLGQLLVTTAQSLGFTGEPVQLLDPAINIDLMTRLLGQLRKRWGDSLERVYSAYNSGNPDKYRTSAEVATNVTAVMTYLKKYTAQAIGAMTRSPVEAGSFGALLVLALVWFWSSKK